MAEGSGTEQHKKIDVDEWLKKIKLGDTATKIIKDKDVTIEELMDFEEEDLQLFAHDLGLDTLAKYRMIKSIKSLKTTKIKSKPRSYRHVIVSSDEHNAIMKLYAQYDKVSTLSKTIQHAIETINDVELKINNDISNEIDFIINNLKQTKNKLLNSIHTLSNHKINTLNQQINASEKYVKNTKQIISKYEQGIKFNPLNEINKQLQQVTLTSLTAPQIKFHTVYYINSLNKLFVTNTITVNDCDYPKQMTLTLKNVDYDKVIVLYALNKIDMNSPKQILEIKLEYACLHKSYVKKLKKIKMENSEYKYVLDANELEDIDLDTLDWQQNDTYIKCKRVKSSENNKYKFKDLKENKIYLMRICARNSSGFGPYSKVITVITVQLKSHDEWDYNFKCSAIKIEKKKRIVFNDGSNGTWNRVLGKKICKHKSGKYHWKLKLVETTQIGNSWKVVIGICGQSNWNQGTAGGNYHYFICFVGSSTQLYDCGQPKNKYGEKFENLNDEIDVYLDTNKSTLAFKINGNHYGNAFTNLPKTKYRLAVDLCKGRKIRLI